MAPTRSKNNSSNHHDESEISIILSQEKIIPSTSDGIERPQQHGTCFDFRHNCPYKITAEYERFKRGFFLGRIEI
jgi:hypothetical protein